MSSSNNSAEEKKGDKPYIPYSPDQSKKTYVLNEGTLGENKVPLDLRLVMGLPSAEEMIHRSQSPPTSRPTSQERKRPTSQEERERRVKLGVVAETTQEEN